MAQQRKDDRVMSYAPKVWPHLWRAILQSLFFTAIIAVAVVGAMPLFYDDIPGWLNWPVALGFMALVFVLLCSRRVEHARRREALQTFILNNPARMPGQDGQINVLYLRSFLLDELMVAGTAAPIDSVLISAGRGVCSFFALGDENRFGIRMKRTSDANWFEEFKELAKYADIIVMTPFATKSTTRETQYLVGNHTGKTLIYVPRARLSGGIDGLIVLPFVVLRRLYFALIVAPRELPRDFPRRPLLYSGYLETIWTYSRTKLRQILALVPYDSEGALWSLKQREGTVALSDRYPLDQAQVRAAFGDCLTDERQRSAAAKALMAAIASQSSNVTQGGDEVAEGSWHDEADTPPGDRDGQSDGGSMNAQNSGSAPASDRSPADVSAVAVTAAAASVAVAATLTIEGIGHGAGAAPGDFGEPHLPEAGGGSDFDGGGFDGGGGGADGGGGP